MYLRNEEYPHPKISTCKVVFRRQKGQVQWVAGFFFVLFMGILLCAQLQLDAYRATSSYLEDALAASNLASAIIDLEEFGRTHNILIAEPEEAYEIFGNAVKENLHLNDAWEGQNEALISGRVEVVCFIVYNVKDDAVIVHQMLSDGSSITWQENPGNVFAPNGLPVETTAIYSELTFPVEGFLGVVVQAHKGKLVDIVANEE